MTQEAMTGTSEQADESRNEIHGQKLLRKHIKVNGAEITYSWQYSSNNYAPFSTTQIIHMLTINCFRTIKLAKTYFVDKIINSGTDKFVQPLLTIIEGIDTWRFGGVIISRAF